jgi:hypothetical protein
MTRSIDPALVKGAAASVEGLLELLFDGLDWPRPANLTIEDVPLIDLEPADLHLREDALARLGSVQQLPRLTAQQPFGVFILTFEGERLPIGAIRRVVDGVVRRKRSPRSGSTAVWDLDDLVFFCRTGDGGGSVHAVAFRDQDGKRALRAISWSTDMPPQKLELLSKETLTALQWPNDGGLDVEKWRAGWRDAFQTGYRQGARSAEALADIMAGTAREVRNGIRELIQLETDDGPLRRIFTQVRGSLREDLDEPTFADMYAQTMVYGLLTARITHPEDFSGATNTLAFENPFLDALYTTFRSDESDTIDIDEFGLLDLADLLARTDVDSILAEFGAKDPRNDPVIYFYEQFLERYDSARRKELGTYYTPIPVVHWIVDAVDHLLRTKLGFSEGIADSTTWEEYAERTKTRVPQGIAPEHPVLRALDPATGTGTFLLEWLRQSAGDVEGSGRAERLRAALERIDAFEIELPGYTVAHLKASLALPRELRSSVSPGIVLTDTLAGRRELQLRDDDVIAEEGVRAERLKFSQHHNIIIGNPPYRRLAQAAGGGMITEVTSGRRLIDDFYETALANAGPRYLQQFYNLYIYFWRWASWKAFEQVSDGPAIIGFITPSSWLTGRGFMGVRKHLRQHADDLYILDLGGEQRGAAKDPNIFGIQSPVAITIAVRTGRAELDTPARVHFSRVAGTREEKLASLESHTFSSVSWQVVDADWLEALMPPTGNDAWMDFPELADLIPWQQSGAIYSRTWPIAPDPSILRARWGRLLSTDDPEDRAECFKTAKHGRKITTRVGELPRLIDEPVGADHRKIVPFAYRSFDRQWTFEDPRLAFTESPTLWASLSGQQVFMAAGMTQRITNGPAATVSVAVPEYHVFCGRGSKDILPLYRDASGTPNMDPNLLKRIAEAVLPEGDSDGVVIAEQLFTYIFGVLSGCDYTNRFEVELETPGPRIPLTANRSLFERMAEHGRRLIWLDTFAERFGEEFGESLPAMADVVWQPEPSEGPESTGDVSYNPSTCALSVGDGMLLGVRPDVAAFEVSGMNVLDKWLGYRTLKGTGRSASSTNPLDRMRHERWIPEWSRELRELVIVLSEHLLMQREGTLLLEEILAGPLVMASDLPEVDVRWRQAPASNEDLGGLFGIAAED